MERSLSVLLPVRDVQSTLASTVFEILEILPELTSRFELIVIDDGSTDATLEVADDLAAYFPQVKAVRHAQPLGHPTAIKTGLKHASGDIIFLRDNACELALDQIRKLWWAIDKHPLVLGRPIATGRREPWRGWRRRGGEESFRMIDRQAIQSMQQSLEAQAQLMASMPGQEDTWFEIEIGRRCTHRPTGPTRSIKKRRERKPIRNDRDPSRSDQSPDKKIAEPKYLRSIKDFAVGE